MSTQITRVPVGLQSFLGTQAQGKNPSELAQVVAPVLDIGLFLGVQQELWYADAFTPFSDPDTSALESVTVPEGETWILKAIGARLSVQSGSEAGIGFTLSGLISNNSNSNAALQPHPLFKPYVYELSNIATSTIEYFNADLDSIVAPPGTQITLSATQIKYGAAGVFNPSFALRYLRLKI